MKERMIQPPTESRDIQEITKNESILEKVKVKEKCEKEKENDENRESRISNVVSFAFEKLDESNVLNYCSETASKFEQRIINEEVLKKQLSVGFTGETWYDFDLPLSREDPIVILHFNDVYNIEPNADGTGGIARFITALRENSGQNPLILFSGDAFNPSFLSAHTRGRHMIPFLNMAKIHTACFGNHDFDFGIDHLEFLAGSTRFPWILSNVLEKYTSEPLANAALYRLFEWQGIRVGIIGLIERECIETLTYVDIDELVYKDFVNVGKTMTKMLREKEVELVIALTHMRAENDEKLAREVDIDIILGGHDHYYYGVKKINETIVCKSGTDFREFTRLVIKPGKADERLRWLETVDMQKWSKSSKAKETAQECTSEFPENKQGGMFVINGLCNGSLLEWDYVNVLPEKYKPNLHVSLMVDKYISEIKANLDKVVGELAVPLETRFCAIRTQECNSGNWFCDLMRNEGQTEIALLNSGTIRSDCVFHPGVLTMRHLCSMLPMNDPLVILGILGKTLLQVLNNSISMLPKCEGRFLQVSGLKFSYAIKRKEKKEEDEKECEEKEKSVIEDLVFILNQKTNEYEKLDENREYTLITKEYLYNGKDGFDALQTCRLIRDSEIVPSLLTIVRNNLTLAAMANGYKKPHTRMSTKMLETLTTMDVQKLAHHRCLAKIENVNTQKTLFCVAPRCEGRITRLD